MTKWVKHPADPIRLFAVHMKETRYFDYVPCVDIVKNVQILEISNLIEVLPGIHLPICLFCHVVTNIKLCSASIQQDKVNYSVTSPYNT